MEKVNIGDRIRIVRMDDNGGKDTRARDYDGRAGIVGHIESLGQLYGSWGGLAVIPGVDEYEILR
jgi:hypothetical protein